MKSSTDVSMRHLNLTASVKNLYENEHDPPAFSLFSVDSKSWKRYLMDSSGLICEHRLNKTTLKIILDIYPVALIKHLSRQHLLLRLVLELACFLEI